MIQNDERDEIIRRGKKVNVKPRAPKPDHKHEYEKVTYVNDRVWGSPKTTVTRCSICGKIKS